VRIAPETETEIARLLDAGWSRRAVATATRTSRGTVDAIATGRRAADLSARAEAARRRPEPGRGAYADREPAAVARCGECGGLVQPPCRACAVRRQLRRAAGPPGADDEPLTISLMAEDFKRYVEIRQARDAAAFFGEGEPEPTDAELREIEAGSR